MDNYERIQNDIEALMEVHCGGCPECGHDVEMVAVGGTREFFEEYYAAHSVREYSLAILDGKPAKGIVADMMAMCFVRGRNKPHDHFFIDLQAGVSTYLWNRGKDKYSDRGCEEYQCTNPQCRHKYEIYNTCVRDWSLVRAGQQPHAPMPNGKPIWEVYYELKEDLDVQEDGLVWTGSASERTIGKAVVYGREYLYAIRRVTREAKQG